jgi:flavin reductase (DIM6/NTAB) family NADH-FMN oxidoreductase RutF
MSIDESLFRQAMSRWTTGVTIVTSRYQEEQHGLTVSSFTSISVQPPIICVSVNEKARSFHLIEKSGIFGVSILEEKQGAISECFAGRVADEGDRFYGIDTFILETGSPLISNGIAFFDCKVINRMTFSGNSVFFGEVVAAKFRDTGKPLLYTNRTYKSIQK